MSNAAYVPPHLRNMNNGSSSRPRGNGHAPPRPVQNTYRRRRDVQNHYEEEDSVYAEALEQMKRERTRAENAVRTLEMENAKLKQQIMKLESDLSFYTSKGAKVPAEEFTKLQTDFNAYKQQKYNEFASIKDKLKSHDETVMNLNREIRKLEEENRLEKAKVNQYMSSVKDLNAKIKALKDAQAVPAPQPAQQSQQQQERRLPPPPTKPDQPLITDDWDNIKHALDFVLSLDKKEITRAGFNPAALKYTRQLIG